MSTLTFPDVGEDHLNGRFEDRHFLRATLNLALCNSKEVLEMAGILFPVISTLNLANIKQARQVISLVRQT
jgi:hypothetical protein